MLGAGCGCSWAVSVGGWLVLVTCTWLYIFFFLVLIFFIFSGDDFLCCGHVWWYILYFGLRPSYSRNCMKVGTSSLVHFYVALQTSLLRTQFYTLGVWLSWHWLTIRHGRLYVTHCNTVWGPRHVLVMHVWADASCMPWCHSLLTWCNYTAWNPGPGCQCRHINPYKLLRHINKLISC